MVCLFAMIFVNMQVFAVVPTATLRLAVNNNITVNTRIFDSRIFAEICSIPNKDYNFYHFYKCSTWSISRKNGTVKDVKKSKKYYVNGRTNIEGYAFLLTSNFFAAMWHGKRLVHKNINTEKCPKVQYIDSDDSGRGVYYYTVPFKELSAGVTNINFTYTLTMTAKTKADLSCHVSYS